MVSSVDSSNRMIAWMKRGQRVDPGPGPVRINLGAALAVAPGWIHVDSSPNALLAGRNTSIQAVAYRYSGSNALFDLDEYRRRLNSHRFVHHDLAYGVPFIDASVDFVYSSHLLEHLTQSAGLHLLRDCCRVLRPGGVIRVCVPDLEKAVQFYLRGERKRFLAYFFNDGTRRRSRHSFMYDFELLREALSSANFVEVVRCGFQTGRTPDLVELDNRSDETLYVEAVRPN
jgi:SAM-dependent methyltransferase